MFASISGPQDTKPPNDNGRWRLWFGGAAVVLVGLTIFGGAVQERAAVPKRATSAAAATSPKPPADPDALIAQVDAIADRARLIKNDDAARLHAFQEAERALNEAYQAGAPDGQVGPRREVINKALHEGFCKTLGANRAGAFRDALLTDLGNAGISADVRVSGKCSDTITIDWPLWSDVTVHQFFATPVGKSLAVAGFKTVRLKAWDQTWTQTYE